jgi:hypothetical protein
METTPPSPGGAGAPTFSFSQDEEMNAPDEKVATPPADKQPKASEEDDEEEEEEDDDVPEPEKSGANPKKKEKKEETSESSRFVKGFAKFISETYEYVDDSEEETCPDCGTAFDEFGANCGCNM